ncbi:MAG: TonB-dependent receptor [Ignavibacteriales bacterium]|nr:TonB-dependent receptor [Ignavibacteriales bacterium]
MAQQLGTITGRVVDKNTKQPIVGANVVIVSTTLGASTDQNGFFSIKGIQENVYQIKISIVGYNTLLKNDVRVIHEKSTEVGDIELSESTIVGQEIVVTSSGFEEQKEAPVSYFTYSQEEIWRSPGAVGDIFRAVEALPGVSSSGGEFSAFSVRGGGPHDNLILIDNIPFDKVSHFDGGNEQQESQGGRFSIFTPGLIDQAKFYAGGFSSQFGSKHSSVIDLTVKEGNRTSATVNGRADITGGEVNYNGPSYLDKSTGILVSARYTNFKEILKLIGRTDNGLPSFSDFILKTSTDIDPSNKISFLGIFAPEHYEHNVEHVLASKDFFNTDLFTHQEDKALLALNWRLLFGTTGFLQNSIYYRWNDQNSRFGRAYPEYINGNAPTVDQVPTRNNISDTKVKEIELGWKSSFTYSIGRNSTLINGVEVKRLSLNSSYTLNQTDTSYVFDRSDYRPDLSQYFLIRDPARLNFHFDDVQYSAAAFSTLSLTMHEALTLNPGIRFEYSDLSKKSYLSPRLSATYAVSGETRINVATGIYYQVPTFKEIASDEQNKNLSYERAYHVIMGLTTYFTEDLKFTAETYYKKFDNLVVQPDRTSPIRTNGGDGTAAGIDLSLVRRFSNQYYGQISYSYAYSKRDDHNGEGIYDSEFNQPHTVNILFGYQVNQEWTISAKWKYATGKPTDAFVVHPDVHNSPNFIRYSKEITAHFAKRLPAFHSLNLRIDYRKQFNSFAIVSFLDILNSYDRSNVNLRRFLEASGKEQDEGIPILPTIGVRIEF